MSTLRRQEPVGTGLKRIACERVEAGVRALTRQADQTATAALAIRQATAVLELIAPHLPRATARRDLALAERLRDGLVEIDRPTALLARLNRLYKKSPPDDALAGAVKSLRKQWAGSSNGGRTLNSPGGSFDPAIYRLVADMAELRGHVGEWHVEPISDDAPYTGLRRTYNRARRLVAQPIKPNGLGDLIIALSALSEQLTMISKACPPMIKAQRKLLNRACEVLEALQADHALDHALRSALGSRTKPILPDREPVAKRLSAILVTDLQPALAETPAAFINRMRVYGSAWRDKAG